MAKPTAKNPEPSLNKEDLEQIISKLPENEARTFLRRVWFPGNTPVTEAILSMRESYDDGHTVNKYTVLKKETEFWLNKKSPEAKSKGVEYGKKWINEMLSISADDTSHFEIEGLKTRGKKPVIEYAISILINPENTIIKNKNMEKRLESATALAKNIGDEKLYQKLMKRFIEMQKKGITKNSRYARFEKLAETYEKIGDFENAIDLYLKEGKAIQKYNDVNEHYFFTPLAKAVKLAKEHNSPKLKEAYIEVLSSKFMILNTEANFEGLTADAALNLKTQKALQIGTERLHEMALNCFREDAKREPKYYLQMIEALQKLDLKDTAKGLIKKVADYELKIAISRRQHGPALHDNGARANQIYALWKASGATSKEEIAPIVSLIEINNCKADNCYEKAIKFAEGIYKIIKSPKILELQMELAVKIGRYDMAAKIAKEIKPELVPAYEKMRDMPEAFNNAKEKRDRAERRDGY